MPSSCQELYSRSSSATASAKYDLEEECGDAAWRVDDEQYHVTRAEIGSAGGEDFGEQLPQFSSGEANRKLLRRGGGAPRSASSLASASSASSRSSGLGPGVFQCSLISTHSLLNSLSWCRCIAPGLTWHATPRLAVSRSECKVPNCAWGVWWTQGSEYAA